MEGSTEISDEEEDTSIWMQSSAILSLVFLAIFITAEADGHEL